MRYATENTAGNAVYADLIDNCRHSRLRAAMAAHQPRVVAPAPLRVEACSQTYVCVPHREPIVSANSKAYLTVACMSLVSMLSVVVSGALNA